MYIYVYIYGISNLRVKDTILRLVYFTVETICSDVQDFFRSVRKTAKSDF
jgi:hypothetical protein